MEGDRTSEAIIGAIAREWNAIGVSTLPQSAPPDRLWGPLGYQYSDRMTGCLYTWTNANDPDDLFYWHSSQIPTSPGGSGGNLPAFFYPYSFQDDIDSLTVDAASELDFGRRQELYGEIQALLAREAPVIFLCWEQAFPAAQEHRRRFLAERLDAAALERCRLVPRQRRFVERSGRVAAGLGYRSCIATRHIP